MTNLDNVLKNKDGACALQQEKPPQWEARAPQLETILHLLQLEKACAAVKTQHSQKQINKI